MYFPIDIVFSTNDPHGGIRLKVAALCACLDHGYFGDIAFTEEELAPFTEPERFTANDGIKFDVWLRPHSFVHSQPTGNIERAVNKVLNGLAESISKKELNTLQLRMDLEGVINLNETWIQMGDFLEWCEIRKIDTGDLCSQYQDDETKILEVALDEAHNIRTNFETPYFDQLLCWFRTSLGSRSIAMNLHGKNL